MSLICYCDVVSDLSDQMQHPITNRFPIKGRVSHIKTSTKASLLDPHSCLLSLPSSVLNPQSRNKGIGTSFMLADWTMSELSEEQRVIK